MLVGVRRKSGLLAFVHGGIIRQLIWGVFGIGWNTVVLMIASAILYLAYTVYLVKRISIRIGLLPFLLQIIKPIDLLAQAIVLFARLAVMWNVKSYLRL